MDPITIATTIASAAKAAKAAWDTGESLYLFIKSTQNVTKTVQDLAKSVKAFGDTCDLVHSSLETLEAAYESNKGTLKSIQFGSDQLVWRGIQGRLEECQEIIQELRKSMSDVTKEHSSFVGQAWRQFKLNAKQEDRTVIQARLQNHTTALSLSLQAIKIRVDHLISRQADNDLLRELQELRALIERNRQGADQIKPTDDLVQYAQTMFDDGATLYKASVASGSITDDTETATIMGEFRQNDSDWISQWSAEIPFISSGHDSSLASPSSEAVFSGRPSLFTADTSVEDDRPFSAAAVADNCDSDDDFDLEIAKQTITDGLSAFGENKFEEADATLSDAVQQLQQIPEHRRSVCSLSDLQYKLAVCSYHLKGPDEAAKRLLAFVQRPSKTDDDRNNVCKAGHLLAQAYVRLNKLELARSTCDSALKGRRRLFGQRHQEYYESMALMARIMELQGNDVRSKTYLKQVPEDQRQRLSLAFGRLDPPSEPSAHGRAFNPVQCYAVLTSENPSEDMANLVNNADSAKRSKEIDSPRAELGNASVQLSQKDHVERLNKVARNPKERNPGITPVQPEQSNSQVRSSSTTAHGMDMGDPSVQAVLEDLLQMGITEDQIAENADFIKSYLEQSQITAIAAEPDKREAMKSPPQAQPLNQQDEGGDFTSQPATETPKRRRWLSALGWEPRGRLELKMADTESDFAIVVARKQMRGIAHSSTALITAALFGESNVAEALIENGADVNETREVPSRFGSAGRQAVRALHVAVAAKHPTMVQLLLDKGASVKGGHPPPCVGLLACFFHPEWLRLTGFKDFGDVLPTLEALQKAGVDVNTIDGSGLTQLHWAASLEDEFVSAREGLVRYLLARGSSVLKHSKVGWTPLHYAAASNSSAETINALLEMRRLEQINDMDHTGQTALHLALGRMSRVSPDVVRALLKAGSDPHFKRNPIARTPINLARGLVANGHIDSLASLGFPDN